MNGTQAIIVMDEQDRYDYILRGLCSLSHTTVNQTRKRKGDNFVKQIIRILQVVNTEYYGNDKAAKLSHNADK